MASQRQHPGTGGGPSVGRQVAGSIPASAINDSLAGEQTSNAYAQTDGAAAPDWRSGEWIIDIDETPLGDLLADHQDAGMDFVTLVSDYHARRGTGKSTLSVAGARWSDTTEDGVGREKVTQSPEEFIDAYATHPGGSGLVFDEAESGINARNAMHQINKQLNDNQEADNISVKNAAGDSWWHMSQNTRRDGLDDPAVRRAAVWSIPKEAIVKQLLFGFPKKGWNLIGESFGEFSNPDVPKYQGGGPEKTRDVLKEAGYVFDDDGMAHFPAE